MVPQERRGKYLGLLDRLQVGVGVRRAPCACTLMGHAMGPQRPLCSIRVLAAGGGRGAKHAGVVYRLCALGNHPAPQAVMQVHPSQRNPSML